MPFEMDSTISIHAPREGGDDATLASCRAYTDFNPRPPRGGRRLCLTVQGHGGGFQSTPPARGATLSPGATGRIPGISIHAPPRGGRPCRI